MKKLIFLLPFFLYAAVANFSICYEKYSFINKLIPVTKTKSVTFIKPSKYLYYDPFTKLYVLKSRNKKFITFFFNPKLGWWMAGIKKNAVYGGTYAKKGYFLSLSTLSVKTPKNAIISDIFCRAYGVSRGDGFLNSRKLIHFVKYGYWGDIGIGVDENLRVLYSDPFYTKIKPGERILFINHKRATPEIFTKYILLGIENNKVLIVTNRHKTILKIRKLRYLYTPLEHYGIKVNKNLIAYLPKNLINKYFLKEGKIVLINGKKVTSFNQLLYLLSFDKNVTITLQKDGIIIDIPLRK